MSKHYIALFLCILTFAFAVRSGSNRSWAISLISSIPTIILSFIKSSFCVPYLQYFARVCTAGHSAVCFYPWHFGLTFILQYMILFLYRMVIKSFFHYLIPLWVIDHREYHLKHPPLQKWWECSLGVFWFQHQPRSHPRTLKSPNPAGPETCILKIKLLKLSHWGWVAQTCIF